METHMKIFRQGDVLIKEIKSLPKDVKLKKTNVLVWGEVTLHSHRLQKGEVYEDKVKNMFLNVTNKTMIVHEEHKPIKLEKGVYAVIRQKEYTSGDMTKLVVD